MRGAKDIERINCCDGLDRYCPMDMGGADDAFEHFRTKLGRQLLGIIQTVEPSVLEEDNRCSDDGAGQRAATGFIDASNKKNAPLLESALVPE